MSIIEEDEYGNLLAVLSGEPGSYTVADVQERTLTVHRTLTEAQNELALVVGCYCAVA